MDLLVYLTDLRTLILAAIAILDLIIGTIAHTRVEGFNAEKFGIWFDTNVLKVIFPFAIALLIALQALPTAIAATQTQADIAGWILLIPALVKLGASLIRNLQLLFRPTA